MDCGRVYLWRPDPAELLGGRVVKEVVPLLRLDHEGEGKGRLWGRHVRIRNAGAINQPDEGSGKVRAVALGDSKPNHDGDFLFEPGRGGARVDKVEVHPFQSRYVRAAHFGEVNTYYHLDFIASYVHELLAELSAPALPPVIAVVNAHNAATDLAQGIRDGLMRTKGWLPFQGGHYRLASQKYDICEHDAVSPDGEIHLGPGWQLWQYGALAERSGKGYRANASHNVGIIYHEYGHHITRHTADFRGNFLLPRDNQNNRKTALDEGTCDYWAATMLGTPHIWAFHHRHDDKVMHPRSLVSTKTMADFDHDKKADPHLNGTIWGAALWDLRTKLCASEATGVRHAELLLLKALLLIGKRMGKDNPPTLKSVRAARNGFTVGLGALLEADEVLFSSRHRELIETTFAQRGVFVESKIETPRASLLKSCPRTQGILKHVAPDEIPETEDLFSGEALRAHLQTLAEPPLSLIVAGDIMLGGRTRKLVNEYGADYPFQAVLPLLRSAPIGLGNLEGPFARKAKKEERRHSYRVDPKLARSLARNGINVVTLANNHLLDCGREGVLETFEALRQAGVTVIGAGVNKQAAHEPRIFQSGRYRIGLLGYYWNRRTSATARLPGSAMDGAEDLAADISALRSQADRVVVTFHWGVPYARMPSEDDRTKAHFAVDCGADAVIGHHPHIVQPFEIYRDRPVFYSIGNFTFGSGNSRAESLLLGLRFEERQTFVYAYPVYVKNRDPRVNYQPKILQGNSAERILQMLAQISGAQASSLKIDQGRGSLVLPWRNLFQ